MSGKGLMQLSADMRETLALIQSLTERVNAVVRTKEGIAASQNEDPVLTSLFREEDRFAALKEAFKRFDVDGNGKITREEFYALCQECGDLEVPVNWVFDDLDVDSDGCISWEELKSGNEWEEFFMWVSNHAKSSPKKGGPGVHEWKQLYKEIHSEEPDSSGKEDVMVVVSGASEGSDADDWNVSYLFKADDPRIEAERERYGAMNTSLEDHSAEVHATVHQLEEKCAALSSERDRYKREAEEATAKLTALLKLTNEGGSSDPFLELKAAFMAFDTNGDGRISKDELAAMCSKCRSLKVPVDWVLQDVDEDGDGYISWEEFSHVSEWRDFFTWVAATAKDAELDQDGAVNVIHTQWESRRHGAAEKSEIERRLRIAEEEAEHLRAQNADLLWRLEEFEQKMYEESAQQEEEPKRRARNGRAKMAIAAEIEDDLECPEDAIITNIHATKDPLYLSGCFEGRTGFIPTDAVELLPFSDELSDDAS